MCVSHEKPSSCNSSLHREGKPKFEEEIVAVVCLEEDWNVEGPDDTKVYLKNPEENSQCSTAHFFSTS